MRIDPLRAVKVVHTAVWAFFVACILAIPLLAALDRFRWAALFVGIVALEVVALVANGMRCPLTDVATRYAEETSANFDIFLPEWLARHNKSVFGSLYLAGIVFLLARWFATR